MAWRFKYLSITATYNRSRHLSMPCFLCLEMEVEVSLSWLVLEGWSVSTSEAQDSNTIQDHYDHCVHIWGSGQYYNRGPLPSLCPLNIDDEWKDASSTFGNRISDVYFPFDVLIFLSSTHTLSIRILNCWIKIFGSWRYGSVVKHTQHSCRGPELNFQHTHGTAHSRL